MDKSLGSPGVEGGAVEQGAVEVVAYEVGSHHGAFAVFGVVDGFSDNQVAFVPHIQHVDVEHQGGVGRDDIACGHGFMEVRVDVVARKQSKA